MLPVHVGSHFCQSMLLPGLDALVATQKSKLCLSLSNHTLCM